MNDANFPPVLMCAGDMPAPGRIYNARLAALRAQYPFLEINPTPVNVVCVALDANIERTVQLPEGTQMVRFTTDAALSFQVLYIQLQGKASIPTVGSNATVYPGPLVDPRGWYYVGELRQISLVAPGDMNVSIQCHIQA